MNRTTVYPGTFDPVTYGHIDVVARVAALYDKVYVAVAVSEQKDTLFTIEDRVNMLKRAVSEYKNVEVESFNGLVVDYAVSKSATIVIRGLRMISDFEYEFQMALTNRQLRQEVETVFMMPNAAYSYLSSRLIKEIASMGADVSKFVPPHVREKLRGKFTK
ncbi:MAG: pantetheine-phosphate adenylyltransferase [Candidatus Omnitrophica bacterium]|nr:pantetheine-phosphate adenylyltransferase [Candidatus Omnitrophota bacterium]MBU1128960.1 pantetheine-phosphate adenylyltransferase [Candidatus Omnitrophota bacterium]MBU1784683.1 pantetheine-phosphate adenylyltransferase [Candidatus Omnitrophota bacterium]MBU1850933.1 pantetheine-phosphate adenylyltransferase [Candidatus Omnitrophota bacterium]